MGINNEGAIVETRNRGVFETTAGKTTAWWREISAFLSWGGHHDTGQDLIVRMLRNRLSKQVALPADQRLSLHKFNYHWWRPITAPGKINPGLVIPWHCPEVFDYQQQSDAFNQTHDEGALRESAWQRRRAVAQRLSLAFARAPRRGMLTRFAPSAARAIGECSQRLALKSVRNLKQIPPPRTGRRRTPGPAAAANN